MDGNLVDDPFLPEEPLELLKKGTWNKVAAWIKCFCHVVVMFIEENKDVFMMLPEWNVFAFHKHVTWNIGYCHHIWNIYFLLNGRVIAQWFGIWFAIWVNWLMFYWHRYYIRNAWKLPKFKQVPLIIGTNKNEGLLIKVNHHSLFFLFVDKEPIKSLFAVLQVPSDNIHIVMSGLVFEKNIHLKSWSFYSLLEDFLFQGSLQELVKKVKRQT